MARKLIVSSFILSISCVGLFLLISFTPLFGVFRSFFGENTFAFLLFITIITFLMAVLGLKGVKDWKSALLGIPSILITLSLSALLAIIVFFGRLFN